MLTWLWAMGQEVVAFIDAVWSRLQRLAHLAGQFIGVEHPMRIPADHAGYKNLPTADHDAIGIALGPGPTLGK